MTGLSDALSQSLSIWFQTSVFWLVIAVILAACIALAHTVIAQAPSRLAAGVTRQKDGAFTHQGNSTSVGVTAKSASTLRSKSS